MTTAQSETRTDEEQEVYDIGMTISESIDAKIDADGPNWGHVAQQVFDHHVKPALVLAREVEHTRQGVAAEASALRGELSSMENLLRMSTERANRQAQEVAELRTEIEHARAHSNGASHA